jgi:3-hydroxyisobutyrate dehydrogenase
MANVAFLGLGVMGFPMAGWLQRKGHSVTVFNRTAAKAERWSKEYGGRSVGTPAAAAENAEIVFSCLGDDPDLRDVHAARLAGGGDLARGVHCLDAPVSGGQAGAENGKLTVMVGGDATAFATAEPVIRSYAHNVKLLGPAGSGQLTKMVNQIAIAGVVQGLAEALNFARKAGLDVATVIDTISKGAAQSWQMENRWKTMSEGKFDFGFAVEWMRKDLRICLQEARNNGAELPVAALVDQFYADVIGMGGKRWDTSSLIARLNRHEKR